MNPLQEYNSIIHLRQQNPLSKDEYGEVHHIIPRSCGGCNKKWNLVKLTPEEHYRCHYFLTFIYSEGNAHDKMVYAWNQMHGRVNGEEVGASIYAGLKEEYAAVVARQMTGNTYRRGSHHTEEAKRKNAEAHKGNKNHLGHHLSEETKQRLSALNTGKQGTPHTDEAKRKISEARRRYWANKRSFKKTN